MECAFIYLGVFKSLLNLSHYHQYDFYLGNQRREIESELLAIQVPHDFNRKPRSLNDLKYFKGQNFEKFLVSKLSIS